MLVLAVGLSTTFVGGSGSLSESSSWSLPVLWLAGGIGRGGIVYTEELVKVLRGIILVCYSLGKSKTVKRDSSRPIDRALPKIAASYLGFDIGHLVQPTTAFYRRLPLLSQQPVLIVLLSRATRPHF